MCCILFVQFCGVYLKAKVTKIYQCSMWIFFLTCLSLVTKRKVTFLLLSGALLQVSLQVSQLHTLRGVGRCKKTGRVQGQALVVTHVSLSWKGVLQLQVLQLLGQNCLTAAQITMRSSGLCRLLKGGTVHFCLRGGAGNRVRDLLMFWVLENSDRGWGRRLAVCGHPIESLSSGDINSINGRCRNIKVSCFMTYSGFSLCCWGLWSQSLLPVLPHQVRVEFHCRGAGKWTPADDWVVQTELAPQWVYSAPGEMCC